MTLQVGLFV